MAKSKYYNVIIGKTFIQAFYERKLKFSGYLFIYADGSDPVLIKKHQRLLDKVLKSLKGYDVRVEDVMYDEQDG